MKFSNTSNISMNAFFVILKLFYLHIRYNTRKSFSGYLEFISVTKSTRPSIVRNAMEDMEESVAETSAQLLHVLRGFYTALQCSELWNVGLPYSITGIMKDNHFVLCLKPFLINTLTTSNSLYSQTERQGWRQPFILITHCPICIAKFMGKR